MEGGPFSYPNSSDSMSWAGSAAQFTLTSARAWRGEWSCRARATSSLPVPVSPVISTVVSRAATCSTWRNTHYITGAAHKIAEARRGSSIYFLQQVGALPFQLRLQNGHLLEGKHVLHYQLNLGCQAQIQRQSLFLKGQRLPAGQHQAHGQPGISGQRHAQQRRNAGPGLDVAYGRICAASS
jgi:hypothetical protein